MYICVCVFIGHLMICFRCLKYIYVYIRLFSLPYTNTTKKSIRIHIHMCMYSCVYVFVCTYIPTIIYICFFFVYLYVQYKYIIYTYLFV